MAEKQGAGHGENWLVAHSGALRLRPEGIHVKADVDPANWFLNASTDVRSSCHLEEVATEFDVQGLELDWVGVCWDGNLVRTQNGWQYEDFKGTRWVSVHDAERARNIRNAYRVLLTRARQGMVLFVPQGSADDATRLPARYSETAAYLSFCGIPSLGAKEL